MMKLTNYISGLIGGVIIMKYSKKVKKKNGD